MTKQKTLKSLQTARAYHEEQMKKIEALVYGKSVDDITAVSKRECHYGIWLYSNEEHLRDILGLQFYNNLESFHAQWHAQYYRIHQIYFKEEKKGFFAKIRNESKIAPLEIEKAKVYYRELRIVTNELLRVMTSCERRINALQDSKFH
ncbi:MAG: CZB domain-containing protein [Sulfurimonadaceae bacterium]|jgi:hypothetical protein|nr:CZB domain-containing protein [Sulfurimonadaceae bacterium]